MSTRESFTQQYLPLATSVGERLQVDPNLLIAQWGLETGWGKSVIPGTNNLGNIKDFSGGGVAATDNMTGSRDKYLKFDTPEAFGDHYVGLINRKYPRVAGTGSNAEAFAQALRAGGYAEDPNYVSKIVNIATGQQLPNATAQGNTMNPSGYNPRDPNSVYQFILQNQQDVPVQQLTPEQRQMLMADRQKRASMLPLAIGASLAGDKRVSGLGKAMYDDAIEAQGAMKMGNEGWLTPDGQLIENPFTQATRKEGQRNRALEMAVQAVKGQQDRSPYFVPIQTANGVYALDSRTGTAQPVMGVNSQPIVGSQSDPALQGKISNAREVGAGQGKATVKSEVEIAAAKSGLKTLDAIDVLLDENPTASYGGKLVDEALRVIGVSTKGGDAAAQIKVESNKILMSIPRFEGPQSDKDTAAYKEAAGDLGNDTLPISRRRAAVRQLREIMNRNIQNGTIKFDNQGSVSPGAGTGSPPSQSNSGSQGNGLTPEEQRELDELREWNKGRR